ncbi:hypothetical protein IFM89_000614 [Coptis chinensis]|uniref:Bet v I/Major latex protein domain-containing protein n=1 Tax=Coptis chinensis TaxID=261450 RepID=A0A835LQ64_9MAGN|nr:hypothetical protein IFM89_000614 [Coptis chinensis]
MRMEVVLVVFLMFIGTINCERLIFNGRPLLHRVTNEETVMLYHELEVAASADEVWSVEGSPELGLHLPDLLPAGIFAKFEITGDGGEGSILDMTFPPGQFPHHYREKFVFFDHKNRYKLVEMIDGDFFDLGVTYYMDTIRVVATGPDSCVIKSSTEYHVKPEFAKIVKPLIDTVPLAIMSEAIAKVVLEHKHKSSE